MARLRRQTDGLTLAELVKLLEDELPTRGVSGAAFEDLLDRRRARALELGYSTLEWCEISLCMVLGESWPGYGRLQRQLASRRPQ
jgi:hypothetical protein